MLALLPAGHSCEFARWEGACLSLSFETIPHVNKIIRRDYGGVKNFLYKVFWEHVRRWQGKEIVTRNGYVVRRK